MIEQGNPDLNRDLVSATRDEFERRGGVAHREFAILLEVERINRLIQALAQPHLTASGLTYAGWQALMALAYSKHQALPMAKLAERVASHPTTITRTIDRLVRHGYVRRVPNDDDRRVTVVEILSDGDRARKAVLQSLDRLQFGFEGIPEARLDHLEEQLRQARVALTEHLNH